MVSSKRYRWTEISNIPQKPGVYAWYYLPEITDFDLKKTIAQVTVCRDDQDMEAAYEIVKCFLQDFLFRYFQEEPYQAILRGSLKPRYEGLVEHKPELSENLLRRVVEEPERLITIKQVLEKSAPDFASPIYIGMSDNLGRRLKLHKSLIEKYSDQSFNQSSLEQAPNKETEDRDKSFAMRICSRHILPTRLFVTIDVLENVGKRYVDIENILNRIHHPLLGRN
jgi:hypothetical protein